MYFSFLTITTIRVKYMCMTSNLNNQELAAIVFNDALKAKVSNALKNRYGIREVNYKSMNYGMGIIISGNNNFDFIRGTIEKVTGIPIDSFNIIVEDKENNTAFYVYMPEKDKNLQRKLHKQSKIKT